MAYFEDLTPYGYLQSKWTECPDALSVGWLDKSEPFDVGAVPAGFPERLAALVARPVNLCRGWHTCWCSQASGNGEIRVTGADGTVYAAPVLIAHYVAAHGYRPPQGFIDAVMEPKLDGR